MLAVSTGPFMGRFIDRLVPWYASIVATILLAVFQSVHTAAGGLNVAAVIIACFGLDVFLQPQQVSLTASVFTISATARSRLNAIMIISFFIGQVIGTSVGTKLFVNYGWRAASSLSIGLYGLQILILLARGPHAARYTWFGYEGGFEARKSVVEAKRKEKADIEAAAAAAAGAEGQSESAQPTLDGHAAVENEKQKMAPPDV